MDLPAHEYLEGLGIAHQRLSFPPETEKGAAGVARALGFEPGQMVKTLIFETGAAERVLVMAGCDKNGISGHLKRAIGSRNIKLAGPDTVKEVTGYEIGSIPPFHWQTGGFRSFLDACLMDEELLGVGAGAWGEEILLTPQNLVTAVGAIVVNLTDKSKGVYSPSPADS